MTGASVVAGSWAWRSGVAVWTPRPRSFWAEATSDEGSSDSATGRRRARSSGVYMAVRLVAVGVTGSRMRVGGALDRGNVERQGCARRKRRAHHFHQALGDVPGRHLVAARSSIGSRSSTRTRSRPPPPRNAASADPSSATLCSSSSRCSTILVVKLGSSGLSVAAGGSLEAAIKRTPMRLGSACHGARSSAAASAQTGEPLGTTIASSSQVPPSARCSVARRRASVPPVR